LRQLAAGLLWLHRKDKDTKALRLGTYARMDDIEEQPVEPMLNRAIEKNPAEDRLGGALWGLSTPAEPALNGRTT
jgi:hypothetical protein